MFENKYCVLLCVAFVVVGVILRSFRHSEAMYYQNDQGLLLLTSHAVMYDGHRPAVGPPVSLSGVYLPPYMYYIPGMLMKLGQDPTVISSGYIFMNIIAGLLLCIYAAMIFDVRTGLWTLGLFMLSASMVENGRSIWQAHPSVLFVVFYLVLTEYAAHRKNHALYVAGLFVYALAGALYPTPLIILPFVYIRLVHYLGAIRIRHNRWISAVVVVVAVFALIYAPWLRSHSSVGKRSLYLATARIVSGATIYTVLPRMYVYVSVLLHDVFRIWEILPDVFIGSVWTKATALALIATTCVVAGYSQVRKQVTELVRTPYAVLVLCFFLPALFDLPWPAYRMLPFYPFVFVLFGRWVRVWMARDGCKPLIALTVFVLFIAGNSSSWIRSTVVFPRNEYPHMRQIEGAIIDDVQKRGISGNTFGVHFFTPQDQTDYYAPPLWYLLRLSAGYRVDFTQLGHEADRKASEHRHVVYLVCDGFGSIDSVDFCVQPFLDRWRWYAPIRHQAIAPMTTLFVLQRLPT